MNFTRLLLLMIFACSLSTLSAQDDDDKPAILTFTAGWSYADLALGDDDLSADPRNGFFAGVRKDIKLVPMLRLNTGLLYTQQGGSFNDPDFDYESSYLDIPVGLKFKIGGFFATGGVSGNIKLSDNMDEVFGDEIEVKTFDLAYSFGVGVKVLMFSLDLRWNNSFGDIIKDNPGDDIRNSYFLVGLGFSIHK